MSRLISETRPVARKAHTCAPCRTTIQPGDIYHRQVSVEDLEFSTWKACEPCADIVNEVFVAESRNVRKVLDRLPTSLDLADTISRLTGQAPNDRIVSEVAQAIADDLRARLKD